MNKRSIKDFEMNTRGIFLGGLVVLLNACGGDTSTSSASTDTEVSPITVEAGENQRVVVNKSITINGSVQADDTSNIRYE